MDTIRIETPFNKAEFIKATKIRWRIHWNNNKKQLIQYSIISVVIYFLGWICITEEQPSNPLVLIGIGLMVLSAFLALHRLYSWTNLTKKAKIIADKYDSIKMDCVYELDNDSVKYWDKEKHVDFKWSVFTHYTIYKDYLVLIINDSLINSYLFDRKESDMDNYNKILELVKTKLKYMEIK